MVLTLDRLASVVRLATDSAAEIMGADRVETVVAQIVRGSLNADEALRILKRTPVNEISAFIERDPRCWTPALVRCIFEEIRNNYASMDAEVALALAAAPLWILARIGRDLPEIECEAWHYRALVLARCGRIKSAERDVANAYSAAKRASPSDYFIAIARLAHIGVALNRYDYDTAEALLAGNIADVFRRHGDERRHLGVLEMGAYLAVGRKDFVTARQCYLELLPLVSSPIRQVEISQSIGVCLAELGLWVEARNSLLITMEAARSFHFEEIEANVLAQLAEFPDEIRPAWATFDAAIEMFDRLGRTGSAMRTEIEMLAHWVEADDLDALAWRERCRNIRMRALGTDLEREIVRDIEALERNMSNHRLTSAGLRELADRIPASLHVTQISAMHPN